MTKLLLIFAVALLAAANVQAKEGVLYSEPDDGVMIVRDPELAAALRHNDQICADYSSKQEEADKAAAAAAAEPAKKRLQREKAGMAAAARHAMAACLEADRVAKKALTAALGAKQLDRLQKAAPFEDMVYVQLLPPNPDHLEALR